MDSLHFTTGKPLPLGATHGTEGINFSIYCLAENKLKLCLFNDNRDMFAEIPLDSKTGNIFHCAVKGLPDNFLYGYRLNDSQWILDPYAKRVAACDGWGDCSKKNSYQPLGQVCESQIFDWGDSKAPRIPMEKLVIYEMHVRGFTNDASSRVEFPGTFEGIQSKIPYFLELGINAIELLPIFEFNECEYIPPHPVKGEHLYNYWGYSTVNFFSCMKRYSHSDAIASFKNLVKALHSNGIEIILDVVYNHTSEGNEKGPSYCFKQLDKGTYYIVGKEGNLLNFSGCGNTFNCNNPIVIDLILESLRYWTHEMGVDGFRFDLASIFYRGMEGNSIHPPPLVEAISRDPLLAEVKLIAEAWDAVGMYQVGNFYPTVRWSEWNGRYRDTIRKFIKGSAGQKGKFATRICGSQDLYGGRSPFCSINFITAHDGFSLADLVSYNHKHNIDNGEQNQDGANNNDSWNCGVEGVSRDEKILKLRLKQMKNFHLVLMLSQGVPMLLMGDEYKHTRKGNNNSWCHDSPLNWFLWDMLENERGFFHFYKGLIHFRKRNGILQKPHFLTSEDIHWHGIAVNEPKWDVEDHFIAFVLQDKEKGESLYAAFNTSNQIVNPEIPIPVEGKQWHQIVNTAAPSPEDFYEEGSSPAVLGGRISLEPYSSVLLKCL